MRMPFESVETGAAVVGLMLVVAGSASAAQQSDGAKPQRIELRGMPAPAPGKFGFLAFQVRAPWMDGWITMRYPETLQTSMGLHFIDHNRRDMPPLSMLEPFPRWRRDEATGEVSYRCATKEGIEFEGRAQSTEQEVVMQFHVRNKTAAPLRFAVPQMCLSLAGSHDFGTRLDLTDIHTWIDGRFTSFAMTTPTPAEKGRAPWVLMLTKAMTNYRGPRDNKDGWWFVDQVADHGVVARMSRDGTRLVAIGWDGSKTLMSNTRIPCLHASTGHRGPIPVGGEAGWRGKLYLMPNDPQALLARLKQDACQRAQPRRKRPAK